MDDGIDELLDEIEAKFISTPNRPRHSRTGNSVGVENLNHIKGIQNVNSFIAEHDRCRSQPGVSELRESHSERKNDEMSAAIKEICDMPTPLVTDGQVTTSMQPVVINDKKCLSVCLGCSSIPLGLYSSTLHRCCDRLRCLSCDFRVVHFENSKWKSDTDYLFLRTNMPDFHRIKKQIIYCKGSRAYACQCEWQNVTKGQTVVDSKLKWVCGRH